jgi:NADPH:quinone reductase
VWNGRLLVIGFAGGQIEKVAVNRLLLKNISAVGLHWGAFVKFEQETVPIVWNKIREFIRDGKLRPITFTDKRFQGLQSIPSAIKALSLRETWGKVVVKTDGTLREQRGML